MARILIVDDEAGVRESLRMVFKGTHEAILAEDGPAALARLTEAPVDLVLLDLVMPRMDGLDVLRRIKAARPAVPVVMLTATRTVRIAVDAIKLGALDYLTKPFDVEELMVVVNDAVGSAEGQNRAGASGVMGPDAELPGGTRPSPEAPARFSPPKDLTASPTAELLTSSTTMQAVRALIEQVARRRATVLVTGESGTGKEVVARAIHAASSRASGPFVPVNCAAIPEGLVESELFGHERGAFTDAKAQHTGKFEQAHGGTLFLDEVGELPPAAQAKLLRVLEDPTFVRVGGTRPVTVDVRLVAATNQDLRAMAAQKRFREDLYYRLAVVPIPIPPLRERREDVPILARHFLAAHADELPAARFTDEALAVLLGHDWPGNVRELRNVVERAVALARGPAIDVDDLPVHLLGERPLRQPDALRRAVLDGAVAFEEAEAEFERGLILDALRRTHYVQTHAAQMLGITRRILKYKMDKLGIRDPAA